MRKRDIIMMAIGEDEGITTYELAKKLNFKYLNTCLIVNKLEKLGLIKRHEVESKRHFKPKAIFLTEKGRKYVDYLNEDAP